jgi:hypothetical protein
MKRRIPRYLGPLKSDSDCDPVYLRAGIIMPRLLTNEEIAALKPRKPNRPRLECRDSPAKEL